MKTRVISIILFLVFALFAYWQNNDPDAALWITIYGLVALISLLRVFGIFSRGLAVVIMVALLVYSLFYIGGFFEWLGKPDKMELFGKMIYDRPYIERTREFFGLILGFLGMFIHFKMKK